MHLSTLLEPKFCHGQLEKGAVMLSPKLPHCYDKLLIVYTTCVFFVSIDPNKIVMILTKSLC